MSLHPGDIKIAIEELHAAIVFLQIAESDYKKHPAADNFDRLVNQTRSEGAAARRASLERVIAHLAGTTITPEDTENAKTH